MQQKNESQQNNNLIKRPPIVVVMGHVDHGKTSILDYIKKSRVADKEAGGITQHIGAYEIKEQTKEDEIRTITFIDTPGHEAFSKMRGRGARVADIAVLVVAADEGFKLQTKEALQIIKEEKIPFIVAVNKIDKPNSIIEVIKRECSENEIYIEEWGGETPFIPVSAKTGDGIRELLETILLISDINDFKANPNENAEGIVIESHIDKKRGVAATLIIQNGTLKKSDYIVCENNASSIKIFENFLKKPINSATFSSPVLISGFDKIPEVGSLFKTFKTKTEAENYLKNGYKKTDASNQEKNDRAELRAEILKVNLILKADTSGSLEAVEGAILKLENENVKINILSKKTGDINEEDIKLASVSEKSIIIGFNAEMDKTVKNLADRMLQNVQTFNIIYKLTEWLKQEIEDMAPIETIENFIGKIEVLKVFKKDTPRKIFGGRVVSGKIIKGGYLKLSSKFQKQTETQLADYIGKIIELEKNKVKSDEVKEGSEFGAMAEVKKEIKEGDALEIYEKQTLKKKIYPNT